MGSRAERGRKLNFHYSEKTQQVSVCAASKRPCPLGGFHGSEEAVRLNVEQTLSGELFPKLSKNAEITSHPYPVYENPDEQEFWDNMRAKIGTFVWNAHEFALQPDDPYASTTYCTHCSKVISKKNSYFIDKKSGKCDSCGHFLGGMFSTGAVLSRESLKFFDSDTVRETTWFHTTQNPDWESSLSKDDRSFIHLGTEKAAEDRCETLYRDPDSPTYLYELEIDATATVHDGVYYEDPYQDNTPSLISDPAKYEKIDFDGITRYVNEMEDTGSISLLANPKMLRVKSVRVLTLV